MHHVGWDRSDDYIYDALTDTDLLQPDSGSGARCAQQSPACTTTQPPSRSFETAAFPPQDVEAFFDVHRRGRREPSDWLEHGAGDLLRSWLPG
jgi:hypothetical protein